MINIKLKNQIIDRMQIFVDSATNDEDKYILANEFIDRLFIADYLSVEDMTDLIKNELKFVFDLNSEQIEKILDEYIEKNNLVNDKLALEKIKKIINMLDIFEGKNKKIHNKREVINISKYIIEKKIINNNELLKKFITAYLCKYFELEEEEIKQVEREVKI